MKNKITVSRRNFLKNSTVGIGGGLVGASLISCNQPAAEMKLQREACLVSVDLKGLWPETTREARIRRILSRMEEAASVKPDLVCIPELFDTMWVSEEKPLNEVAENEKVPGPVTGIIAEFAKKHNCYVVCPVFTINEGHFYNSSLLIDRKGKIAGVYHKIHPTKTEVLPNVAYKGGGITPGAFDQPVFETDFGRVGMQICYDTNWKDGWDNLKKKGAEIVLFSSAFPGGRMLNYYAMRNSCYIMSATGQDARIIDISGNDLATTTLDIRFAWTTVNLDKISTPTWTGKKVPELLQKYGDRIRIKAWDLNDIMTIESRDPDIKLADLLKEFNLETNDILISTSEEAQIKNRL
jgi:predicted amidohydrolase